MVSDVSSLRTEVIESQKFKSDLLKWKLILAAALGAAALGINSSNGTRVPELLALIPCVCVYADIVCYHNDLRVLVIGTFLRRSSEVDSMWRAYENECLRNRSLFALENFAMYWATLVISLAITAMCVLQPFVPATDLAYSMCVVAGCLGLLASAVIRFYFRASNESLDSSNTKQAWHSGWLLIGMCAATGIAAWLIQRGGPVTGPRKSASVVLGLLGFAAGIATVVAMITYRAQKPR